MCWQEDTRLLPYQGRFIAVVLPSWDQVLHSHSVVPVVGRKAVVKLVGLHDFFHIDSYAHAWLIRNLKVAVHDLRRIL